MSTSSATPNSTTTARKKAIRSFLQLEISGAVLYAGGLAMGTFVPGGLGLVGAGFLILGGALLWAIGALTMYRMGDEFERAKMAEAVMFAFIIATPLILAVGAPQFFGLPQISWIFAFTVLMVAWAAGTAVAAIRNR